jgi:hypothetical protein
MQPMRILNNWLQKNANNKHYLFSASDLKSIFPDLSYGSFKTLLSRAIESGYLVRLCRGLYVYEQAIPPDGLLLFHIAIYLRAGSLNYISLETSLSDAGVISQLPMNWISIMSSGRSSVIPCGKFGTIEFIHTNQKPTDIMNQLYYDKNCGLWRANVALALRDMKATHRNCDLIDWNIANELI